MSRESLNNQSDIPRQRVNWGLLISCFGIGAGAVVLAYVGEVKWNWNGVGPSLWVNIGTALILTAILFLVEPRFERRVAAVARQGAQDAIDVSTETLTRRLNELQAKTDQLINVGRHAQDEAVARLDDDVSYESVSDLLTRANKLNAIDWRGITIPASNISDAVSLTFRYVDYIQAAQWPDRHAGRRYLEVMANYDKPSSRGPFHPDTLTWFPECSAEEFGAEIIQHLETAGVKTAGTYVRWEDTIRNLQSAVDLAIKSRRGEASLQGILSQMLTGGFALTDRGLEHVTCGLVVSEDAFPESVPTPFSQFGQPTTQPVWEEPVKPEWADAEHWKAAMTAARLEFPIDRGPMLISPPFQPVG